MNRLGYVLVLIKNMITITGGVMCTLVLADYWWPWDRWQ